MPATEMIVMVAIVSGLALAFIHVVRLLGTLVLHRTVRRVVDKDPNAAEGLLNLLGKPPERTGDDRLSTILVAVGVAMIAGALIAVDDPGVVRLAVGAAMFPLILGAALWLRLFVIARARRAGGQ